MQSCEPPAALNVLFWPVVSPKNRVGGSPAFSFVFTFQFIGETVDTPAENGGCGYDFASGVHKYLYAEDDPVNRIDPSGNDDFGISGGLGISDNLSINVTASIGNLLATTIGSPVTSETGLGVFAPGKWNIFESRVPDDYGSIYTFKDRNPDGFQVQYTPQFAGGGDGSIQLYQTIALTGFYGSNPHVDVGNLPYTTAAQKQAATGCGLPPTVSLPRSKADTQYSYWDSPTSKWILENTWKITTVAVWRSGCQDKVLSTYYFEFSNLGRKITKRDPVDTDNYDAAMRAWNK
jgi:hypothetical protein